MVEASIAAGRAKDIPLEANTTSKLTAKQTISDCNELLAQIRSLVADQPLEALRLARIGVRAYRQDAAMRLFQARLERRTGSATEAFYAYNAIRRASGSINAEVGGALFEILIQKYKFAAARRLHDYCASSGIAESFFYGSVAEMALREEDTELCSRTLANVPEKLKRTGRYMQYETVMKRMMAERDRPDCMLGVRHIAIGGVSFVGSTIFGIILGSLPGLTFASETHWLYETGTVLPDGHRVTVESSGLPEGKWPIACRVCGRQCQTFDANFRLQLARMPAGRYGAIARRLNTKTLVTADKNFSIYWMEDPFFCFDLILLYKPLRSQVWSALKSHVRHGGNIEGAAGEAFVEGWLNRWMRLYGAMIGFAKPKGKKVVLNWDEFSRSPAPHLARLSIIMDLPHTDGLLENISFTHFIGGNASVDVKEIGASRRVQLRLPEQPRLSKNIEQLIAAHKEAKRLEQILNHRYAQNFGGLAGG